MMKNVAVKLWLLALMVAAVLTLPVLACAETSGTCGDDLTWVLDDKGTLTISGTGEMWDYSYSQSNRAPWGTEVNTVILQEGITYIGMYAFYECSNLTSLTLPQSVTNIGGAAFFECSRLSEVYIVSVESWLKIGFTEENHPFFEYGGGKLYENGVLLTDMVIPDSVTSIKYGTFAGCSSLTSVIIPDSVTNIGACAFLNCANLVSVMLPDSVTTIGGSSFQGCRSLTGVIIPDSVTSIGSTAFSGCSSLMDVVIPHSVTSINDYTFRNCSALKSVEIQNGVTSIGQFAFDGCNNLTNLTIPDSVTSIAQYAFSSQFASVTLPSGISSFNKYAFYNCHKIGCLFFSGSDRPVYTLSYPLTNSMIYCYEFSEVDFWALENGYKVTYLDSLDANMPLEFSLSVPSNELWVGERAVITPRVVFAKDELPITWSTSNPQVASVADGCVTALATGEVTITATCGTATASVDLTVYAPLESFSLSASELWLIAKEVATVTISDLQPEAAIYSFTVSSSDTTVATATLSDGVISIQALRHGDAVLTVTDDNSGVKQDCTIHVFYPVTAIDFAAQSVALVPGATAQLTATVTCRTQTVTNKLVTFATDDASVASVDENGLVTAIGLGSATITATAASGVSATCTVTVSDLQTSVLPADLVTIEANAFRATAVQCYILPEGVTTIGAQAFASCPNLIRVEIPASVTSIAADAFTGCVGLTIVAPEGSAAYQYAQTYGFAWAAP